VVAKHYERWVYPEPIVDLPAWLLNNWQWFDPSHSFRQLWPNRTDNANLTILIAGCGTNQAAVFAFNNPTAHVVAIDVSQSSLTHHRHLKDTYALDNLELHQMPIEQVEQLGLSFDLIVSTGVLHHLTSPEAGLKALADCLGHDGVIALMVYAHYGRIGVEILQSLFRDLGLAQNEASLAIVKEVLAGLPPEHPIQSYLPLAPDLGFDAGLVDTFLHGRERSYTVDDCLELVASASLVFQEWFFKAPYALPNLEGSPLGEAVAGLPLERQWALMERLCTQNACHFFTACRPERPPHTYRIDFDSDEAIRYVPRFRHRCGLDSGEAFGPGRRIPLDRLQQALLARVDGRRTIAEIADAVQAEEVLPSGQGDGSMAPVLRTLKHFWHADVVAMGIAPLP